MIPPERDLDPRALLRVYGLRPKKGLGQHFLAASEPLRRIVEAAELGPEDTVLEIGPGLGVLTQGLCRAAGRVVAVELDPQMRRVLADQLGQRQNLRVIDADILSADPAELIEADPAARGRMPHYKVVANLPYQITSAVMRHILEARLRPELAVLMVQKEVAERIMAEPGRMSILAVAVQIHARPSLVTVVPASAFHPAPKVDSAVLRLDVFETPALPEAEHLDFFAVVRAGFSQKRKQLKNSLAGGLDLEPGDAVAALQRVDIDPRRRAETLSIPEWVRLTRALAPGLAARSSERVEADRPG